MGGTLKVSNIQHESATSPNIALDASGNAAFAGSVSGIGLGMFKNYIINGRLDFWQRGTSISVATGQRKYLADRFRVTLEGTSTATTYKQETFALGQTDVLGNPIYYLSSICTNGGDATNGVHLLATHVEDVRITAGKTMTLSFYAKASASKNISLEILQDFGTGGSYSSLVRTFVEKKAITTSWAKYTFTFTVPSITGKTIGTDVNTSNLTLYIWMSAGSTKASNTGTLGIQSGTFDFAMFQLEEGSVATNFEYRPYGLELQLCQRYYEKSFPVEQHPTTSLYDNRAGCATCFATGTLEVIIYFKVSKRTATNFFNIFNTITSAVGHYFHAWIDGNWVYSDVLDQVTNNQIYKMTIQGSGFSGTTIGHSYITSFNWTCDAEF